MSDERRIALARAMLGYRIEAGVIQFGTTITREHHCATFPGDKLGPGDYDAWILYDKDGKQLGWSHRYGKNLHWDYQPPYREDEDEKANRDDITALLEFCEVPDIEHDIEAGIAALDALSVSTCIACRLDNNKWIGGKRVWTCEIIDCDELGITAYGATPALAIYAALVSYYKVEVEG